jgi:hypothetical protein
MIDSQQHTAVYGTEALRRGVRDWMFGAVQWDMLAPTRVVATVADIAFHSGDLLALAAPGRACRGAWREGFNKLRTFLLFSAASEYMSGSGDPASRLPVIIESVLRLDSYRGLWMTEGLGYFCSSAALQCYGSPRGLLGPDRNFAIPDRCLIPLHTGMGLAFAMHEIQSMNPSTTALDIRRHVEGYLALCTANSAPGYAGAAVESLGLVARNLRPRLVSAIAEELAPFGKDTLSRFWHGFGRGLYFSPMNVLPCTSTAWPSVRVARREPHCDLGRSNALAGLAWAVTLVNIRQPEVIEWFINRHRRDLTDSSAFASGVRSAAAVWHDWAPQSQYLQALCRYQPRRVTPSAASQWDRYARSPCGEDFRELYRLLKTENMLDELFHFSGLNSNTARV